MDISEMQYNIKRKEYNAAKLKYELGVIANVELTKAINDLYDAQVSYANAKLTYRMAIEKYKYEITTGL
jgi:outer membrane protein TolC